MHNNDQPWYNARLSCRRRVVGAWLRGVVCRWVGSELRWRAKPPVLLLVAAALQLAGIARPAVPDLGVAAVPVRAV